MSDSFADLWKSSAPAKQTLSSISSDTQTKRPTSTASRPKYDAFAALASSSPATSRPITPITSPKPHASAPAKKTNGDAFSDLFSTSGGGNNSRVTGLTIAERARKAEQDKLNAQARQQARSSTTSSAWLGLDALGAPTQPSLSLSHQEDDWFTATSSNGPAASVKRSPVATHQAEEDDWGLSELGPPTVSTPATSQQSSGFKEFASNHPVPPTRSSRLRSDSPGRDFDFGEREDGLLSQQFDDADDDILGELGKPQQSSTRPMAQPSINTRSPQPSPRAISPPPHIIGQIVEMGFSPQQARIALAATDTGLDVQAAIESLISNNAASGSSRPNSRQESQPPRRQAQRPSPREREHSGARSSHPPQDGSMQEQAEKVLSQASEIGMNMFGKASAFWSAGKDRVQKAYEERVAATADSRASSSASGARSTRPRWMTEEADEDDSQASRRSIPTFTDHDDGSDAAKPATPPTLPKPRSSSPPTKSHATVDLFSVESDAPPQVQGAYVSKFRHGRPKQSNTAPARSSLSAAPASTAPMPPPRPKVSASSEVISSSQRHKATGTEKYKLGQYADAVSAYSLAISVLPSNHLLLVALHNNRALAQIKTGEYGAAVQDATAVIDIVGPGFVSGPSAKISGPESEGGDVDLADGLLKAWKRRAEALEGKEKWDDARKDWERVAGAGWANSKVRSEGVNGAGRCRKMATDTTSVAQEQPKPKPKPPPARPAPRRGPTPPSVALETLRKANQAQADEDDLRHELKDSVDARLNAWKGGKETNIRGLISSLDTVLWPELGWESVGMKDLITEKQVKLRYTKAIGRLHPDKLNATNTELEHRMIANGVFGALNDAWNAFQQQ